MAPIAAVSFRLRIAADAKFDTTTVNHRPVLPVKTAIISFLAPWSVKGGRGASAEIRFGFQSRKVENA